MRNFTPFFTHATKESLVGNLKATGKAPTLHRTHNSTVTTTSRRNATVMQLCQLSVSLTPHRTSLECRHRFSTLVSTPNLRVSASTATSTRSSSRSDKNNDGKQPDQQQVVLDHLSNNENVPGGTISILTLNRPNAANAMSKLMLLQLQESLAELESSESRSRCVILASASPRVFSAGADLKERKGMTLEEAESFVSDLRQTMHRVSELPMPVIAAISGTALGGGLELALCADIRVASKNSILGLVETSLAIVPGAGGTQRLPRIVGVSKAKELIFTASKLSAKQALECGLVDHVVDLPDDEGEPSSQVLDKAIDLAWEIARNGPIAVRAAKQAINQGMFAKTMQEALNVERACYAQTLSTKDRLEGLSAFAEKRAPQYRGE